MGGRAVVTGGAGFLGTAFRTALAARGWEVVGVDVRPAPGVETGDVTRPGPWTELLAGADLVVHTAAVVSEQAADADYRRVNVHGTAAVLDACEAGDVGRLLHLSSIVVHGTDFPDGVDERAPMRPTGNPYTDTKLVSEAAVTAAAAAGRVRASVVRPGDVYGPGSAQWTVRVVQTMRAGQFALLDRGRGVLSPVYVDDLVEGALAVAAHPEALGGVFHVTGGEGVRTAEFFGAYAAMLGIRLRSLPLPVARVAARVGDGLLRLGRPAPFSSRTLEYLSHPGTYSIERVRATTGWMPSVDLVEGMCRTEAWLRAQGLLD